MPQHHAGGEEEGGGVGQVPAGNVRGGAMDGLENGAVAANVAAGGQAQATNQAGAQIADNVAVQIGHDHDGIGKDLRVLHNLCRIIWRWILEDTSCPRILPSMRRLDSDWRYPPWHPKTGRLQPSYTNAEIAVVHNSGLVDHRHVLAATHPGILKGILGNPFRSIPRDQLYTLHHSLYNLKQKL